MRRALASLLVFVLTFVLVARGVAAPLMHLHPGVPAPATPVSVSHQAHDHADCAEAQVSRAVDDDGAAAHTRAGHTDGKGVPVDHGKACDSNGACCGQLVLSEASDGLYGLVALPEPSQIAASAGVKPLNPDRPPSLPIA
jgi:hypothetical protein